MPRYDLRLDDGSVVHNFDARNEADATARYEDLHRDDRVIATRPARDDRYGMFVLGDPNLIDG